MNTKTSLTVGALLLGVVGLSVFAFSSCGGDGVDDPQAASVNYLKATQKAEASDLNTDTLLLYVDYSTCVAEAMNSSFFQEVQPTIVSNHPAYFSIKGDKIARENGDTYTLLRSVKEVNNADIKSAINRIADNNRQAILITDAEYWHPGVGDNLTNPYMKGALGKWLSAGRDIYIYAEPYIESGKYNKKRYYIIFTDDRLDPKSNINKKMEDAITSLGDVKKIHLSARAPKAEITTDAVKDDDGLMMYEKSRSNDNFKENVPMFVFSSHIYDIATSLQNADENKAGNQIDLPIVSGIKVPVDANGIFNIDDYDVKVYDLTSDALDFATVKTNEDGDTIANKAKWNPVELDDVLELGEKELENGEFALYFDKDFIKNGKVEGLSLLKVEILADDAKEMTEKNDPLYETLSWESISKAANGGRNNSFFESVKQALINDKTINPSADGRNVVASFYIYTEE